MQGGGVQTRLGGRTNTCVRFRSPSFSAIDLVSQKVLFGLAVGIVVAVSEGVLYILWSNPDLPYDLKKKWQATQKKLDEDQEEQHQAEPAVVKAPVAKEGEKITLRQRHQ